MKLVIVESPSKAKTINKYLGKEYKVLASFGHLRDLVSKNGSVDPDNHFEMKWEINPRGKKHFQEITQAIKKASALYLATDPDREGEAISWHLIEMLKEKKALKNIDIYRVVFNEITKDKVRDAFNHPRALDQDLVDAYLARRALDYLVGFTLSPVLWRKLPGSKSAGRVQSVALRIIAERELDIEKFKKEEYWSVTVGFKSSQNDAFEARLTHLKGEKLTKFSLPDEKAALEAVDTIKARDISVHSIEHKQVKRHPAAPFTTSTLQQEASRKLGMSAKQTMRVAQSLYEGFPINGETTGLITYMRTDGVQISTQAIEVMRNFIQSHYGKDYLPSSARHYKTKAKNAQEAHEAIRPTDITHHPETLKNILDHDHYRLYNLIWKRALASQMQSAVLDQAAIIIVDQDQQTHCRANGSIIKFLGFLALYKEGKDDQKENEDQDKHLPPLKEKEKLSKEKITPLQHFTEAPPRYSEASLVKNLEELGIGRPSTYATILSVLQERSYVTLENKRFIPEERGRLVTCFLKHFFERYVQYEFTADLENQLDLISDGQRKWTDILKNFWQDFNAHIKSMTDVSVPDILEKLEKDLHTHYFPDGDRTCPQCKKGQLDLKLGKFGAFLGCNNYPDCRFTRQSTEIDSKEEQADAPIDFPKIMGQYKDTSEDIILKKGPFGFYLQVGEVQKGKKTHRAPIPKEFDPLTLDLSQAHLLLSLPRLIGKHPETHIDLLTNFGRFGPYLHYGPIFLPITHEDVLHMDIKGAVKHIQEKRPTLRFIGMHEELKEAILFYRSKFGYVVACGDLEGKVPKESDKEAITVDMAAQWLHPKKKK